MKIEKYDFGKMVLDGKSYESDLIIFPEKVQSSWWRKEGHFLQIEDIESILTTNPKLVIVGSGYYGCMKISPKVIEEFKKRNIELVYTDSKNAVEEFNRREEKNKVGAFHLTC